MKKPTKYEKEVYAFIKYFCEEVFDTGVSNLNIISRQLKLNADTEYIIAKVMYSINLEGPSINPTIFQSMSMVDYLKLRNYLERLGSVGRGKVAAIRKFKAYMRNIDKE